VLSFFLNVQKAAFFNEIAEVRAIFNATAGWSFVEVQPRRYLQLDGRDETLSSSGLQAEISAYCGPKRAACFRMLKNRSQLFCGVP